MFDPYVISILVKCLVFALKILAKVFGSFQVSNFKFQMLVIMFCFIFGFNFNNTEGNNVALDTIFIAFPNPTTTTI